MVIEGRVVTETRISISLRAQIPLQEGQRLAKMARNGLQYADRHPHVSMMKVPRRGPRTGLQNRMVLEQMK